ncbi:fumarylacetoacetate hydrolase family protein [Sneathiella marina]|uniref:Fumarylacetoacetate hydrolase family protein n=2 Tax=Sneathiella marina TaxID=2950108 RepID=A0ABY4W4J2_9PROT|nr:fumarylacetoacetate hydrolase family protein [Sneathiella marina]USG61824.1 fumarylacetoacetate hydrolase family protein [Sneathiella marina]
MEYVFEPSQIPTVAVKGTSKRFPVRRIFCVGRNYAEHTREMGGDPDREPPFFFTKPADAVVDSGAKIPFPQATNSLHHEMELVVAISKGGVNIAQETASDHIFGYGAGIDLTRRDLQQIAKDKRRPWDSGKAFDQSAPCAALTIATEVSDITNSKIWLTVNGETRQSATIADLIWSIEEVIAFLSAEFALKPGDLIYTGTPAGVGAIQSGDKIEGCIEGLTPIAITLK